MTVSKLGGPLTTGKPTYCVDEDDKDDEVVLRVCLQLGSVFVRASKV